MKCFCTTDTLAEFQLTKERPWYTVSLIIKQTEVPDSDNVQLNNSVVFLSQNWLVKLEHKLIN